MGDFGKELQSLMGEKQRLEGKLTAAGGTDFDFLLEDCTDLLDIVDEIQNVSSKRGEKEHAAFDAKIKFSRKVRRKAKDLNNFEQHLVKEYENKHITLEHGRKMAAIIKLLRTNNVDRATQEAAEFYGLLEMGARLEIVMDLLSKKRAHVERAKRGMSAQLSGLEWLENEPRPDQEKIDKHDEKVRLNEKLGRMLLSEVESLKSMPLEELLKKMRGGYLEALGFPEISAQDADSLSAFLQKSKLESKSAGQLYEMSGQSEQRLRHFGVDLPLFRQEIVAKRTFLSGIASFQPTALAVEKDSPALPYLSGRSEEARKTVAMLFELEKTKEQDEKEWERANRIKQRKAELAGLEKSALIRSLQEFEALENVLDGKADMTQKEKPKKGSGIVKSILDLFGGK